MPCILFFSNQYIVAAVKVAEDLDIEQRKGKRRKNKEKEKKEERKKAIHIGMAISCFRQNLSLLSSGILSLR